MRLIVIINYHYFKMLIGIYKIVSPVNKIYIGQSIDIRKRFYNYKLFHCKPQIKLYNSLKKYGVNNHKFEILHLCNIEELNILERYYQELFEVNNKHGLNLRLTGFDNKSGKLNKETIEKMKNARLKNINANNSKSKKVIDLNTNIVYNSCTEIAKIFNISASNLSRKLNGTRKNNTTFKYL